LDTVGSLSRDLEAYEKSAEEGKLLPLPGDTVSEHFQPSYSSNIQSKAYYGKVFGSSFQ